MGKNDLEAIYWFKYVLLFYGAVNFCTINIPFFNFSTCQSTTDVLEFYFV